MTDDWDASAIAAVAALIIALFALLVAVAQALQQYFITGQLIRLCDSVVFGPLPGQGYRIWQFSQFRFQVLYSIPQINLEADLWPKESPHIKSYAIGEEYLPDLDLDSLVDYSSSSSSIGIVPIQRGHINTMDMEVRGPQTSSESWSSSTRSHYTYWNFLGVWLRRKFGKIRSIIPLTKKNNQPLALMTHLSCGGSVRYRFVTYDADRCPSDLVTAPMQVSMRDIAVMGLTAGMKITDCSFREKSISMQGAIGTITTSNHPILGPILHFTPRAISSPLPRSLDQWSDDDRGVVNKSWLAQTWDVCTIAKVPFNSLKRRTTRRLDDRWTSYQAPDQSSRNQRHKRSFNTGGIVPVDVDRRQARKKKKTKTKKSGRTGATLSVNRRPQDGIWTITQPHPPPQSAAMEGNGDREKPKEVQRGTGEDDERHVTPLHRPASTNEPNSLGEQDTAPAKELHQQFFRQDSTSQQAQPSGQSPAIETKPECEPEMHPGQCNNSTQHGTKGKGQSDDIQATPVPEPLLQGQPKQETQRLKRNKMKVNRKVPR
ncbi:uncharacterized protein BKA55DRAFT_681771 [Fusarium redolens]|uniref:Uncharacterized protein n=1 Tax=Fusarium redolens TaxID=48865 RepID=A0A9P9FY44_FUSRE|nr:uncharacterized protein BKA55DRAFT_681771 [Fusarium redolens]KAH7205816.1 hypothetical protein BKA55DRAFT_681771 [Fusarium redolens]